MTALDSVSTDPIRPPASRPSLWRRVRLWADQNAISLYALILTLLLGVLALAPAIIIEVPSGHVGVLWLRFWGGTVTERVYSEGTHLILPWDRMVLYDVRLRNDTRRYETLAANGMALGVEVALRYRINPPAAGLVHKLVGTEYAEKLVHPKIASLVYEFVAQRDPEYFYALQRAEIQNFILKRAREEFPAISHDINALQLDIQSEIEHYTADMVRVEDVLVAGISLPPLVRQAIDRKVEQQQIMQEYDFRIEREKKERDRKRIEAEGIRDFQETVAYNITPEYLRLRGVEATRAFADSANAKTIIIGGRDGLPVILNTGDDGSRAGAGPASPAAAVPAPTTTVVPIPAITGGVSAVDTPVTAPDATIAAPSSSRAPARP